MSDRLVLTALAGMSLVRPGDDLGGLIGEALMRAGLRLESGDVLVVTQRIVQVILGESQQVLRVRPGLIIVRHRLGFVCANAGVDHSNVRGEGGRAEDWVLKLPLDPDASAGRLRECLEAQSGAAIGVLIIDSHGRAWRMGTVGVAIGVSGFPGLLNLRGRPDLFGYRLQVTEVGLADELAGAASILTGQANEGRPVVHVRGLPYPLREGSLGELIRPQGLDLFR
jgi:coenzyme F420-0:L-glutamate ligase/coenzyme F420-1:gamma-L-glutamate ligase